MRNNCFGARINISNVSITFEVPMKINKNTANAYICYEKYD